MKVGELVRDLRVDRAYNPGEIISTWSEKDLLDGKVVDAWVIIFRTRGCYWAHASGCSMCGYVNDTAVEVSEADIAHQLASVLPRHQGQPLVKVYTSGNFFDDHELAPESRRSILEQLGDPVPHDPEGAARGRDTPRGPPRGRVRARVHERARPPVCGEQSVGPPRARPGGRDGPRGRRDREDIPPDQAPLPHGAGSGRGRRAIRARSGPAFRHDLVQSRERPEEHPRRPSVQAAAVPAAVAVVRRRGPREDAGAPGSCEEPPYGGRDAPRGPQLRGLRPRNSRSACGGTSETWIAIVRARGERNSNSRTS